MKYTGEVMFLSVQQWAWKKTEKCLPIYNALFVIFKPLNE